ncbi:predicted protein [Naegleria gruberi]|uniref:poly(ADP-ribose) glycohydrolase n=1 Tax=Naegleria gruberi TaxID=5762 RepID=D2V0M3_NAEGR|nr:uncharacterized protein NAEGRDRAFT_62344 [Naegleria gruberi]EFC49748.1 predicted protein [Naegleria gruberi]|eukprot:XP_002682492.1 predicted protein [Naegleria gruberi strain NEG-M]
MSSQGRSSSTGNKKQLTLGDFLNNDKRKRPDEESWIEKTRKQIRNNPPPTQPNDNSSTRSFNDHSSNSNPPFKTKASKQPNYDNQNYAQPPPSTPPRTSNRRKSTPGWNRDCVKLPCHENNVYFQNNRQLSKWYLIKTVLQQRISDVNDIIQIIKTVNSSWSFSSNTFNSLETLFNNIYTAKDKDQFFNTTLPCLQSLALDLPNLIDEIPLLKKQEDSSVTLTRKQICCLLIHAFFCTFPRRNQTSNPSDEYYYYPSINFITLFKKSPLTKRVIKKDPFNIPVDPKDTFKSPSLSPENTPEIPQQNDTSSSIPSSTDLNSSIVTQTTNDSTAIASSNHMDANLDATIISSTTTTQTTTTSNEVIITKTLSISETISIEDDLLFDEDLLSPSKFEEEEFEETSLLIEKLKTVINYFNLMAEYILNNNSIIDEKVSFERKVLLDDSKDMDKMFQNSSEKLLSNIEIRDNGTIEDNSPHTLDCCHVDFANKMLGGGVLGNGAVQEEIRFLINTECIIGRLFTEELDDNETLLIRNTKRFSTYEGYSYSYRYTGTYDENCENFSTINYPIIAIDALNFNSAPFRSPFDQFKAKYIQREINKIYCGFIGSDCKIISTGNLGK